MALRAVRGAAQLAVDDRVLVLAASRDVGSVYLQGTEVLEAEMPPIPSGDGS